MRGFRSLEIWEASIELVDEVYALTRELPEDERFGLSSQLRRAAVSIPSNIAEGYARSHRGDYLRHLSIARGSLAELQTQLIIVGRQKLLPRPRLSGAWKKSESVGKMLTRLIQSLKP